MGRDAVLSDLLHLVIAGVEGNGRSVVVVGPAGIGKSTVLTVLAADARSSIDGLRVLRLDGLATEAHLPLAALTMLSWRIGQLGAAPGGAAEHLADLLTSGLFDEPVLDNATLQALAEAAEEQPVLLAVDDAQWVDPVSARSIVFALRRLDQDGLIAVVAARDGHPTLFETAGFEHRQLLGIGAEHAVALFDAHFGSGEFASEVAEACALLTGGNPLAMVEVGRAVDAEQRKGRRPLPDPLPVGDRVVESLKVKVTELDPAAQLAVTVVAVGGDDPGSAVAVAVDVHGRELLRAAVVAGIVTETDDGPRVTDPLYRQVILDVVEPDVVRRAHGVMVTALGSQPAAAWHRAAAAVGTDDEAADAMDAVAALYLARGDPALAARAFERSAELSSQSRVRFGRSVRAGRSWWEASLPLVAIDKLGALYADTNDPGERAAIAGDLGDALAWRRTVGEGVGMITRSAREVEHTAPDLASLLNLRASLLSGLAGDAEQEFTLADRAVELADVKGGPLVVAARIVRGLGAQMSGRRSIADDDLALGPLLFELPTAHIDSTVALVFQAMGVAHMVREEHDAALRSFDRVIAAGEQLGQSGVIGFTKACMSEIAFRRGRFVEAIIDGSHDVRWHEPRPHLQDGQLQRDPRTDEIGSFGHATFARAAAITGRVDEANNAALIARRTGDAIDMRGLSAWARAGQALAFLAANDGPPAAALLRHARLLVDGWTEPSLLWHHGDLFEALTMTGCDDEVDVFAEDLERRCATTGTRYGAAVAARHRRIVSGGGGTRRWQADVDAVRWSVDTFGDLDAPFERARSLVVLAGATDDADAAREAAADFDRLGATAWADRARSALPRDRPQSANGPTPVSKLKDLTSAELRVSEAVSRGLTNRAVAEELFISPKTVEYHLRNIFRKLEIARRAELVAAFHTADRR